MSYTLRVFPRRKMQTNSKTCAFTIRLPLEVGKTLEERAQASGKHYRLLAQQAVIEYAKSFARIEAIEKAV